MGTNFILYGANGYTGELVARAAVKQGLRPILAGRDKNKLAQLAGELGLEYRAFGLDEAAKALTDVTVLLNCAGPFAITNLPLAKACLQAGTHYLDIAGEIAEFEAIRTLDADAKAAGVMLMPGVGFGVVPTDCLAAYVKQKLPNADQLNLAFQAIGGASRGTVTTVLFDLPKGGLTRQDGKLRTVPVAWKKRKIDLGEGTVQTVSNPLRADIATAYYSTGIPTIEAYTAFPAALRTIMKISPLLKGLLGSAKFQNFLKKQMQNQPVGPSAQERANGRTLVWAEAIDNTGRTVVVRLRGPEAYDFTVLTALATVKHVLKAEFKAGFQTPSRVYGPDFVLEIEGVSRNDAPLENTIVGKAVEVSASYVIADTNPESVYDYVTTPHTFPKAFQGYGPIPGSIDEEIIGGDTAFAVGALRKVREKDGSVLEEQILSLERPNRYSYRIVGGIRLPLALLAKSGFSEWRFLPEKGGTRIVWIYRFVVTSPFAYPVAFAILQIFMQRAMQGCLVKTGEFIRQRAYATK